jgi:tetratricopeptide (TPR) repeat protein
MTPSVPDPEQILNDAIDLLADGRADEAETMLNAFTATLKAAMNGSDADAERYYYQGRALALLDEWEQALLRFEHALQIKPDHEAALWETVVILMDELDRPELAKTLLEQRLLKLKPADETYQEALASAEVLIRRRDGRPLKPWKAGEVELEGDEPISPPVEGDESLGKPPGEPDDPPPEAR